MRSRRDLLVLSRIGRWSSALRQGINIFSIFHWSSSFLHRYIWNFTGLSFEGSIIQVYITLFESIRSIHDGM